MGGRVQSDGRTEKSRGGGRAPKVSEATTGSELGAGGGGITGAGGVQQGPVC